MKKLILIGLGILILNPLRVNAELVKKRCTCYVEPGITASGYYTRDGVIAGRKKDLGRVAAIYRCTDDQIGEFIGFYEFKDTGAGIDTDGDGKGDSIKKGLSIDVYKSTLEEAYDWRAEYGDYVFIQYIDAEG